MVLENKIEKRLREINHNDDYNDNVNVKNKTNKRKQNKKKEKKRTKSWFYEQDNSSARVFFFFDVHCTTRTWNLMQRFMEDVNARRRKFEPG